MERKADKIGRKVTHILLPVLAIMLIVCVVSLLYSRRQTNFVQLMPEDGVLDLRKVDCSREIFTVANDWDFYPEKLYEASDFAAGVGEDSEESPNKVPYGTHRLLILSQPNQYLTLCGYSVDYGSRVLVNGVEVAAFGKVADNAQEAVPKTGYQTIPIFTGPEGKTELICQYANFVHNDGGTIHATYLSTPQNIDQYQVGNRVVSVTLGGALLILALYFLLHAAVQRQWSYLCLAFCCLIFAFRDQLFTFLSLLPPELPWEVGYRLHIAIVNLLPVSILFLMGAMYPDGKKWIRLTYLGICVGFLVLIATVDTKQLVTVNIVSYLCCLPYFVYLSVQIGLFLKKQSRFAPADLTAVCGYVILFLAILIESTSVLHNAFMVRHGATPAAMLIFVFLMALSISLRIQEREIMLAKSRSRSQMLERMNTLNLNFLHKVAHELKTPLTVISGYAQLTGMQLEADRINDETPENLKTIQQEAMRLADMVTKLMDYSYGKQMHAEFTAVSVSELLVNVQAICVPICLKNHNQVLMEPAEGSVFGNGEMLLQIFINLVVNANRHTQNGSITISASDGGAENCIIFRVADTGDGMDEKIRNHIFEEGFSGDGGSGLGLSICSEAVKAHGGSIWVEKTGPEGTVFAFTVRKTEEETA